MNILLIRHGITGKNLEKKYIGVTDDPLCDEGIKQLKGIKDRTVWKEYSINTPDILFVSPLERCRQTAGILFPDLKYIVVPELSEMNFGIFEDRAYENDLEFSEEYVKWLDSRCEDPVPGGESRQIFTERCIRGFKAGINIAEEHKITGDDDLIAFVVHGGTIMAVMSSYAFEEKEYFEWTVENGRGYLGKWNGRQITDIIKI